MNNESTESDQTTSNQEMRDQLEWDRLQNEALAAQRWRLEQEMQQAQLERESAPDDSGSKPFLELVPWGKLLIPTIITLIVLVVIVFVAFTGW